MRAFTPVRRTCANRDSVMRPESKRRTVFFFSFKKHAETSPLRADFRNYNGRSQDAGFNERFPSAGIIHRRKPSRRSVNWTAFFFPFFFSPSLFFFVSSSPPRRRVVRFPARSPSRAKRTKRTEMWRENGFQMLHFEFWSARMCRDIIDIYIYI